MAGPYERRVAGKVDAVLELTWVDPRPFAHLVSMPGLQLRKDRLTRSKRPWLVCLKTYSKY